jgi:hypothetical protein
MRDGDTKLLGLLSGDLVELRGTCAAGQWLAGTNLRSELSGWFPRNRVANTSDVTRIFAGVTRSLSPMSPSTRGLLAQGGRGPPLA